MENAVNFKPLTRMLERVEIGRNDSDTTLFSDLMYLGEMISKLIVAALVAAIDDDTDGSRYRQIYTLVRADGIGEWASILDEILTGPPSQHLLADARTEQRELTQKSGSETWQYQAVFTLNQCLQIVEPDSHEQLSSNSKVDARRWFKSFARLRNKTRGHGAPQSSILSDICPLLERSIQTFIQNHSVFKREWVYLHRNLSGKYRVTKLVETDNGFEELKKVANKNLPNGIYIYWGRIARVELISSNADASDFYFANGGFKEKHFEMLSYVSGATMLADSSPYLRPSTPLPESETQGLTELSIEGRCFHNLPSPPSEYINRINLESELIRILQDDRHPVITLLGRGGIGKTSLALAASHKLIRSNRFSMVLWFSARDMDLLPVGPKQVKPSVLGVNDMAEELVRLISPKETQEKGFKNIDYLSKFLTKNEFGNVLFIFDNFETIVNPSEVYKWIDTYIRLPNKILITTRHRDFRGDYHIDVLGMTESECDLLIDSIANKLKIRDLLNIPYRQELFRESDGHPYVIKILLGEIAKANRLKSVERIVAGSDEILTALFERTYASLSPAAQRVFLTLCGWRSTVPRLAVEAVLLRAKNEKMPVGDAIDELERSSFIESIESQSDQEIFISIPLAASIFGRKKLAVSPMKSAIEADIEILQYFGASQRTDLRHGVRPRVERLFKNISNRINQNGETLDEHLPMLEFVSRHYRPGWLLLAELYEEMGTHEDFERAKASVRRYIEDSSEEEALPAWRTLAEICRSTGDASGEVHALIELSEMRSALFDEISQAANRLNFILSEKKYVFDIEEKKILVRKFVKAMEQRVAEADATDYSRLAWLCLHLQDLERASRYVNKGLEMDGNNEHCLRLASRLAGY